MRLGEEEEEEATVERREGERKSLRQTDDFLQASRTFFDSPIAIAVCRQEPWPDWVALNHVTPPSRKEVATGLTVHGTIHRPSPSAQPQHNEQRTVPQASGNPAR
jgi:hypothetical protein